MIGACLPNQSALEKHNQEKSPQTFAHLVNFSRKMCLPCLIINFCCCYFDYRINKPLLLCSINFDEIRAQRIIGFFKLNTSVLGPFGNLFYPPRCIDALFGVQRAIQILVRQSRVQSMVTERLWEIETHHRQRLVTWHSFGLYVFRNERL